MKRFVAFLLIVVVGIPWTAFSAARGEACPVPLTPAAPACSYCAPVVSAVSAGPSLEASCCRFLPTSESIPAQAGSIGVTPRPLQSPDLAAMIPTIDGKSISAVPAARARDARGASPPHASPTRTTHLLL